MPRSRYAGSFDPEQIPGAFADYRRRPHLIGYLGAPSPKAAAYTPSAGWVFTVTGATDQRSAEAQALEACRADPDRRRFDAPCFLYAVGNQVVLPQRRREPVTALPSTLREDLLARFGATVPTIQQPIRERLAREYDDGREHKAQAVSLAPPGTWRATGRGRADEAAKAALESCQVVYRAPCLLLAVNGRLEPAPADARSAARDMARARYAGPFDSTQIPGAPPSIRRQAEGYASALPPKAAGYTPAGGRLFISAGAPDQRTAEEQALQTCRADPDIRRIDAPCYLYAVGDEVVLPERLTAPRSTPGLQRGIVPSITLSKPEQ
jgi:hypothetical protein